MIEYNHLGLADKIHFGSSKRIEFIYDAEGQKLAQKLIDGSNTHLTEYIGDLIYVDGQLQTIFHDEGRVRIEDGGLSGTSTSLSARARYQFFITDHLGNTRIIVERVNDTTALVQENHYGVWGEPLVGIGMDGDWNFLFQGKEYVDFEGLNLYDFHSRFYDPWTGRFWQIDGADQFASGYIGMGNNPLVFVDPDGQLAFVPILIALGQAAAIGAGVGGIGYTASIAFSNGGFSNWNWGQFGRSVGIGAASGLVSFGIGSGAAAISSEGLSFLFQTTGHAAWGGVNSVLDGGGFWSGAVSGAMGNIMGFATADLGAGVQIGMSALMGGVSADMSGGSFWQGAAVGATVAGANHLMHSDPEKQAIKKAEQAAKKGDFETFNKVMIALGVPESTIVALWESVGVTTNTPGAAGKVMSGLKWFGKASGVTSLSYDAYQYYNDRSVENLMKLGVSAGTFIAVKNPWVALGVGLFNATGGTDYIIHKSNQFIKR